MALLFLRDILEINRSELKPYCFEIVTRDKTYYLSFRNDDELYSWMDEVYQVGYCGSRFTNDFVNTYSDHH